MKKNKSLTILIIGIIVLLFNNISISNNTDKKEVLNTSTINEKIFAEKIIDGDTISVKIKGEIEKIRIIGINAPESVDPRRGVECFGKESSAKLKDLISNKEIFIEEDPTQDTKDRYGRLLRYVFIKENNMDVGKELIKQGFAYEYTYNTPYKYQKEYREAQNFAEKNNLGLWNNRNCMNNN